MANTTNGARAAGKEGSADMVDGSANSRQKGKRNITPEQALEILQQAVINCQEVMPQILVKVYMNGQPHVMIDLPGVDIRGGNMVRV